MSKIINLITISRILLGPVIFLLILYFDRYFIALMLFLIAGITDYVDGYLARKYNKVSTLGEILDPIADKILITFVLITISIYFSSSYIGMASAIIISREIWVAALRDLNSRNNNVAATSVTFIAKTKTSVQIFTIIIYFIGIILNNMLIIILADILLAISLVITIYTGLEYTILSLKKSE